MAAFEWFDPGILIDRDLELVLVEKIPADPSSEWAPAYRFEMRRNGKSARIGSIDLRIGNTTHMVMYGGHIGYNVDKLFRGNHYAARACLLVLPLARRHGMKTLWITCNPDNWASRRTCELLGAVLVEIVDLPENSDMYLIGERQKCRYRLDI